MSVFLTVSKNNVSQRGLGSHKPHGTTAGLILFVPLAFHTLYMTKVIFEKFSGGSYLHEEIVQWCACLCAL
jgi:hypothetical protein